MNHITKFTSLCRIGRKGKFSVVPSETPQPNIYHKKPEIRPSNFYNTTYTSLQTFNLLTVHYSSNTTFCIRLNIQTNE